MYFNYYFCILVKKPDHVICCPRDMNSVLALEFLAVAFNLCSVQIKAQNKIRSSSLVASWRKILLKRLCESLIWKSRVFWKEMCKIYFLNGSDFKTLVSLISVRTWILTSTGTDLVDQGLSKTNLYNKAKLCPWNITCIWRIYMNVAHDPNATRIWECCLIVVGEA